MNHSLRTTATPRRSGIILLVVLGMLGLFSLLAVSYLVFASRARVTSAKIGIRERYLDNADELLKRGEMQILRGAQGPESALWGNGDLLGDYYGYRDLIRGRIRDSSNLLALTPAGSSASASPNTVFLSNSEKQFPAGTGQSFSYLDGQFLRVPTNLADLTGGVRPWPNDDMGNGRVFTMTEGPLTNLSFEIVRSFGNTASLSSSSDPAVSGLTGAVILDLTPHLLDVIDFDNQSKTLEEWLRSGEVLSLFYKPDGDANKSNDYWGNSSGNPNQRIHAGAPGSDDVGYAFVVNGATQNGFGMGITTSPIAMNATVNVADTPGVTGGGVHNVAVAYQSNYAAYRTKGQGLPDGDADEPHDAPDLQNMFLGYFPVDAELGAPTPSFVRPALVNYLMNDLGEDIALLNPLGTNGAVDTVKLQSVIRMLQRSTLRPLPILNDPIPSSAVASGAQKFQYANFSGSNASLSGTVNWNVPNAAAVIALAQALAVGPWDVDNDGDGVADSVWVDAGLPLVTMADGKVVKPMVAYRIEDLGGRLDVNSAGSLAYFSTQGGSAALNGPAVGGLSARGGLARNSTGTGSVESDAAESFRGMGYGPADMSFGSIFLSAPGWGREMLLQRYGSDRLDLGPGRDSSVTFSGTGNDALGYFRDPFRPQIHGLIMPAGTLIHRTAPLDVWGKSKVVLDLYGQPMIANTSAQFTDSVGASSALFDEATNDPYEMVARALGLPDDGFTLEELEALLRRNDSSNSLLAQRLATILNKEIVAEATAFGGSANTAWAQNFRNLAAQVTVRSNSLAVPTGVVPPELRANVNATTMGQWTVELANPSRLVGVRQFQRAFEPPNNSNLNDWLRFLQVVPPEIRAGRRMNLNRPFGNDFDDNGNGVVDDSAEANPTNMLTAVTSSGNLIKNPVAGDLTPEQLPMGTVNGNDARQLYARHLYCMMMFASRDHSDTKGMTKPFRMPATDAGVTQTQEESMTARKLAQWAVNAADFRDSDAIMTGFEYDENPYDGWDVDGDLTTVEAIAERGVVWGMEAPGLVLSESIAVHDRKNRDTAEDSSGLKSKPAPGERFANLDDDLDQYRIPQAALYLELFLARSPAYFENATSVSDNRANPWGASPDLYTTVTEGSSNQYRAIALDLDKLAPDNNPVWRVGISHAHNIDHPNAGNAAPNPNAPENSPLRLLTGAGGVNTARDSFTGQPQQLDIKQTVFPNFTFDRVIWLSSLYATNNISPATVTLPNDTRVERIYYNRFRSNDYGTQGMKLRGGQYAVIGPRAPLSATGVAAGSYLPFIFGSQVNPGSTPLVWGATSNSPQQITLAPTAIQVTDTGGNLKTPSYGSGSPLSNAAIRSIIGIGAAARVPSDWTTYGNANEPEVGINVSAPNPVAGQFYTEPTLQLAAGYPVDSYYDYTNMSGQLPDEPFDLRPYAPLANDFTDGLHTGTRDDYKTAYLQRLADPTQPYHAQRNPYITVDWITIDLTVFNGEDSNSFDTDSDTPPVQRWVDNYDPDPFGNAGLREYFGTRYKTGLLTQVLDRSPLAATLQPRIANIFAFDTTKPTTPTTSSGATVYFPINLSHDADINGGGNSANHSTTLGYLNHSFGRRWDLLIPGGGDEHDVAFIGAPAEKQFPWITWLDRPYANPYELSLVPFTNAASLGVESSFPSLTNNLYANNRSSSPVAPFPPPGLGKPFVGSDEWNYRSDFQHLLNFFSSDSDFNKSPNYGRIFDWVETPDPFDDSQSLILAERFPTRPIGVYPTGAQDTGWNPTNLANTGSPDYATQWNVDVPMETLRFPFNMAASRTRRGLVNLNTINGNRVYRELMGGISYSTELQLPTSATDAKGAFWNDFVISRRGYDLANFNASLNYPYRFDGRFDPNFPTEIAGAFTSAAAADLAPPIRSGASRTVWPTSPPTTQLSRTGMQATLMRQMPQLTTKSANQIERPLFERDPDPAITTPRQAHQNRDTSAYHRYQAMMRMSNLATDKSNVFAIWMTMGYFEVDVDTMSVGQEYGYDEGTSRRYRSFMIIDRSIPVRFEAGEDHNTRDVILLHRRLN